MHLVDGLFGADAGVNHARDGCGERHYGQDGKRRCAFHAHRRGVVALEHPADNAVEHDAEECDAEAACAPDAPLHFGHGVHHPHPVVIAESLGIA